MLLRVLAGALLLAALTGCANVQPVLVATAAPDPAAGYVAGLFNRTKGRGYAFIVRATEGKAEFTMSLGEDASLPKEVKDQTVAIKIPPGTYTVAEWISYDPMFKEVTSRRPMSATSPLSKPFDVKVGTVAHLGAFDVSESTQASYPRISTYMRIQPKPFTEAKVREAFAATYPNLASLELHCILCLDTIPLPGRPQ